MESSGMRKLGKTGEKYGSSCAWKINCGAYLGRNCWPLGQAKEQKSLGMGHGRRIVMVYCTSNLGFYAL
jgi:hypothetical protein